MKKSKIQKQTGMVNFIKTGITLMFVAVTLLQAAPKTTSTLSAYTGAIDYTDSNKDTGWFAGLYFQNASLENKLELNYERTEIDYLSAVKIANPTLEDVEQNDFTLAWTHYFASNYLFRVGGHYIDTNDELTDEGYVAFAGMKYYQGYKFDMGLDFYYSDYSNFVFTDGSKGLTLYQVEPSIGYAFGDYKSKLGSFYVKAYYTFIDPDEIENGLLEDTYHSGGVIVKNFNGNWTNEIGGWVGKQAFAVRHEGFTVYNLSEERQGGLHLSSTYAFSKSASAKLQYAYESFEEVNLIDTTRINDASTNTISLFLNYNF